MKPKSRKALGKKISLAYKPKRVHYKYMRPNVKIYKHIPLERKERKLSYTWRRWKEGQVAWDSWRMEGESRNGGRMVKKMKMELRENGEEREK